ncbi:MAG: fumarylacetoacetate hydrolase family protein [Anaerolineaceae bacterium]|nr:fumarylacetoacetate hydrolase family protein [Anaerolineaceae bacterium]
MKLVTFQHHGPQLPAIVIQTASGDAVLNLHQALDTHPTRWETLFPLDLAQLSALAAHPDPSHLIPLDQVKLCAPIPRPGKILCVGLNYRDHAEEGGREIPQYPTIFIKASSAVIAAREAIQLPAVSKRVDFEAELAVVIGKTANQVNAADALDYVAGYTIMNDVSARDFQRRTAQWTMGKSCDTFAPMGPWIVTTDEISDPSQLEIWTTLNGIEMQHSNTRHLIFDVSYLIEDLSSVMTLEPGDIISTGTPAGVGDFRDPPVYLKEGDEVIIHIDQIGSLVNPVQS